MERVNRTMLSQREFAAKAGLTSATVSDIETGKRVPSLSTMKKVCDTFGWQWERIDEFKAAVEAQLV
jgi:DNA-binding XRE family transcriptional regulator